MYIIYFLLSLIVSTALYGDEEQPESYPVTSLVDERAIPSLVNLSSLPCSLVNGSVNVISGDYCEFDQNDIVSGPDAYILGHNYCSASLDEGNLGSGWNFLHHQMLEVYDPSRITYSRDTGIPLLLSYKEFMQVQHLEEHRDSGISLENDAMSVPFIEDESNSTSSRPLFLLETLVARDERDHDNNRRRNAHGGGEESSTHPLFISLYEPTGGRLLFQATHDTHHKKNALRHFKLLTKNSGFTNVINGHLSGQTNIKNSSLSWDYETDRFTVVLGDGTKRIYGRQAQIKEKKSRRAGFYRGYHLLEEIKPSGNVLVCSYNAKNKIKRVATYNKNRSKCINEVQFQQKSSKTFAKHPSLRIYTSDNQEHVCYFRKLEGDFPHGKYGVHGLVRPGRPYVRYVYSSQGTDRRKALKKSAKLKKRIVRKEQDDGFYLETEYYRREEWRKNKLLRNRVKEQRAPLGRAGEKITTHRYRYHKTKEGSICTSVQDAHDNITRYYQNKDKRLEWVKKWDSHNRHLVKEHYIWGTKTNEGRLTGRILYDENDRPKLARYFTYDSKGNIVKDTLYGRITENSGSLRIQKGKPHHESCDKIVRSYTYSDDGFNLKTSECDPDGNYTYYAYVKGTNLLKAKFSCFEKEIKKREFFTYDENAILIEHIVDDGNSRKRKELSAATVRYITKITPRTECPHFGEPAAVEECYYDFTKNVYVTLKRTVSHFSDKGLVFKKEIFDQENNVTTFEFGYDAINRVIYTKDPHGREEFISYDQSGRISSKKGPRTDLTTTYEYDVAGRLLKEIETHVNGPVLATCYEYDLLGRKTAVITPQGNATRYEYDALNRITKVTYPTIFDHTGQKIESFKTFSYEGLGTKVVEEDENGYKTLSTYNALGKLTSQSFPDGTIYNYQYDLKGNLIKEVAPNGAVTTTEYDPFDRPVVSKIEYESELLSSKKILYNSFKAIKEIGSMGETITYGYDFAGRKISETLSGPSLEERITTYAYDAKGRLKKECSGAICKKFAYNDLDQLTLEEVFDPKLCSYKIYSYDLEGNRTTVTQNIDTQTATTETSYHPHGLLEYVCDAEGQKTLYKYDYFFVNEHGQNVFRREIIDARGSIQEERFDTRGNLSEVLRYEPFYKKLIAYKKQYYDGANNLVRVEEKALTEQNDRPTVVTLFSYGTLNRLETITEASQKITHHTYNKHGQKEKTIYADGVELQHYYDAKGRLARYVASDNSIDYSYHYDHSDRIVDVVNNLTMTATYRKYNDFGEVVEEVLETGLKMTYAYDALGHMQEMTLPDGSKVAYTYSPFYLEKIERVDKECSKSCRYQVFERDLSGHVKKANGMNFAYDKLGRQIKIEHERFTQIVPPGGFDPMSNLLQLHTKDPQGTNERSFSYDFLSQLTEETGPTANHYSYDSLYNRLRHNNESYSVNSLHSVLSDGIRNFTYDSRGNRITMKIGTETTFYRYDALDRLVEVQTDLTRALYRYDAFHRRIQKGLHTKEENTTTQYLYSFDNEIGAVVNGEIKELRILGEGLGAEIGAAVSIEIDGKQYEPLHDRQGSVAVLLNTSGQVVESYRYDAFGNETISSNTIASINPWRFSSKRVDEETGFVYFGRRYYDPSLGKWLTQDPLGVKAGPNLYAYVLNNPMTMVDLYGLIEEGNHDITGSDNARPERVNRQNYTPQYGSDRSESRHALYQEIDRLSTTCREARQAIEQYYQISQPSVYTRTEPLNHSEDSSPSYWNSFWNTTALLIDSSCLALDIGSLYLIASPPNPYTYASAATAKVGAYGGRMISSLLRSSLAKPIVATERKAASSALACLNRNRSCHTSDYVWTKVSVNGKIVEGWSNVNQTISRIRLEKTFPHRNDGAIFKNLDGFLPHQPRGYYREFVHPTPGVNHAGNQRIIRGGNNELYYSPDHYKTFNTLN